MPISRTLDINTSALRSVQNNGPERSETRKGRREEADCNKSPEGVAVKGCDQRAMAAERRRGKAEGDTSELGPHIRNLWISGSAVAPGKPVSWP